MRSEMDGGVDLSFLTDEEYRAVLKVIHRDSELKKRDSERIRAVQKNLCDDRKKKLVTGQWFDEVKAKRYQTSLHAVDVIKASIRRKKPVKDTSERIGSVPVGLTTAPPITAPAKVTHTDRARISTIEESGSKGEEPTRRPKTKHNVPEVRGDEEPSPALAPETPASSVEDQQRFPIVSSTARSELPKSGNVAGKVVQTPSRGTSGHKTTADPSTTRIPRWRDSSEETRNVSIERQESPGVCKRDEENSFPVPRKRAVSNQAQASRAGGQDHVPLGCPAPGPSDHRPELTLCPTRIPIRRSLSRESANSSLEEPRTPPAPEPSSPSFSAQTANGSQEPPHPAAGSHPLTSAHASRIPRLKGALEVAGDSLGSFTKTTKPITSQAAEFKVALKPPPKLLRSQPFLSDEEREKPRVGAAFTVNSLSGKQAEEETLTDPDHFKNLRHFWEKGSDSSKTNHKFPGNVSGKLSPARWGKLQAAAGLVTKERSSSQEAQGNGSMSSSSSFSFSEEESPSLESNKDLPIAAPRLQSAVTVKTEARSSTSAKPLDTTCQAVSDPPKALPQPRIARQLNVCVTLEDLIQPELPPHRTSSSLPTAPSALQDCERAPTSLAEEPVVEEVLKPRVAERMQLSRNLEITTAEPREDIGSVPSQWEALEAGASTHGDVVLTPKANTTRQMQREGEAAPVSPWTPVAVCEEELVPAQRQDLAEAPKIRAGALLNTSSQSDTSEDEREPSLSHDTHPRSNSKPSVQTSRVCGEVEPGVPCVSVSAERPPTHSSAQGDGDAQPASSGDGGLTAEQPIIVIQHMSDGDGPQRSTSGASYRSSPVLKALARAKKLPAKSMENLCATSDRETIALFVSEENPGSEGEARSEVEEQPLVTNLQSRDHSRIKDLSKSVPMLLSESESDSASEISLNIGWHRKTPSDASHSSDMASVSSVSGSVMSVYSGDFGSVAAQGSVQFALDYSEKNREFQIYVSQCQNLAVVDERKGRTDAYIKTYLLPDKARMGKRKTSVKRRNVNPVFNEILRYKIEKVVLLVQKLNLSVWHNDTLGRNSFLGEVEVELARWDWSNRKLNWYLLKSRSLSMGDGVDHRGEINLAIKYVPPGTLGPRDPPTGEVHIWMKTAKDLLQLRTSGVDSFVKCYVLPDTSKKSYQKTRIVKKDANPIYNHTIVYDGFRTEDLREACVELTVWDHEKLTNHFLGGLRLGSGTGFSYGIPVEWMDSTEEERALWQEMMASPNEWIPGSLLLRSQLGGKRKLK
eukprot:gi/632936137/ref/XP_007892518.1/ PREDICTED: synaptotagmin-like protein 2 [Callorhinchus milii]